MIVVGVAMTGWGCQSLLPVPAGKFFLARKSGWAIERIMNARPPIHHTFNPPSNSRIRTLRPNIDGLPHAKHQSGAGTFPGNATAANHDVFA